MPIMRPLVRASLFVLLLSSLPCVAQTSPAPSTVVAKQGDAVITLDDIDAFAQRMPENERKGFFDSPKRLESLILSLLLQKQLAAEARRLGLDKDEGVKRQVELATDDVLGKARMQRLRSEIKLPDFSQLAHEQYIGNKEKYRIPARIDVKHVLISTKSRSDEEAKKIADTVEQEAKAHPDQFDALVEKYSDDPSKEKNHGLMPDATSDRYVEAFRKASEALKRPGQLSPPVKSDFGYHVIQLVDRTEAHQRSFDEVRPEIIARMQSEYVEKAVREHADAIRNQPLDANADLVASLRERYGTGATPDDKPAPDRK